MKSFRMKALVSIMVAMLLCVSSVSALACTSIYVGSDLTESGNTIFARSEDISNSYNKVYYVSPAGNHTEGEVYSGCYGFTYTFTHDSYSYTAFRDDNLSGECPDCGGTHDHTPYEEGGTNEMGVTVSATESLGCSDAVYEADPYEDAGIEEAEIVTVILSEAATAREGVELLLSIFDTDGAAGGAGLFIADDTETWYIEVVTGHQYIALKLSSSMAFAEPNMSIIGLIDLDDTDNVIASEGIITVAQEAGTYVGDEEANTIDFLASYNGDQTAGSRMLSALAFFSGSEEVAEDADSSEYTISNVDEDGNIVDLYTNIELDHLYTVEDIVDYYHVDGIGNTSNLEIHIFEIEAEDSLTDTVEWVAMDDGLYTVFVPYYPMLTTDTYAAYQLGTDTAEFSEEEPTDADVYYAATTYQRNEDGERVAVEGYKALPDDWADSMYWTFDALSNLVINGDLTDEEIETVTATLADLQSQCYDAYDELVEAVAAAEDDEAAAEAATELSASIAETVHLAVVDLVNSIK